MTATPDHGQLDASLQGIHVPFQFLFPDEASRTGAPASRLAGGASKLGYQVDTSALWLLASASPTPTWASLGAGIAASGLGGVSEGANLGTGIPVFREKTGASLLFRTLIPGTGITISSAASTVTITDETSGANLGTGIPIYRENSGASLLLRTLVPGTAMTISSAASTITITNQASGTNMGTGIPVYRDNTMGSLALRSLIGAGGIGIASATSTITLTGTTSAASVNHFSTTVPADANWNDETTPIWQAPRDGSATIVEILATTSGTLTNELSFNIQHRDWNAMQAAGIDIFSASQKATSAGEQFTSFARGTVDPRAHLLLTTGSAVEAGSVNYLQLTVYYTI